MKSIDDKDIDPVETIEWLDSLQEVYKQDGPDRVMFLLRKMMNYARDEGCQLAPTFNTRYRNSIDVTEEAQHPGDLTVEARIRSLIRWNAMAMVVRAVRKEPDIGGHIGTFASSATLYDVGFNHFWRAESNEHPGDLLFIQGHASPGIYARSYLEGRLPEEKIDNFRREVEHDGVSSYPHPWLMPKYWQFPTVSMGLGPLQAIYQARFNRYLEHRGLVKESDRKVWCFCGDGEMDEPESLGALTVASREKLDNLIFVVNCNLQRLDGPVRGNGKIIQELEAVFRGAGWHVIKVVWGSGWDPLLAKDKHDLLQNRMDEAVDGDYQNYKAHGGAYTRENFFGKSPELKSMVDHLTDEGLYKLKRGGHDPQKIFAAYQSAVNHKGQPVVILAKTVKGYGLGSAGEGMNISHNVKKMNEEQIREFRDRFHIPIKDEQLKDVPFYHPGEDSPEIRYLKKQRESLGGFLPSRRQNQDKDQSLAAPKLKDLAKLLEGSGEREVSTTMYFVRMITALCKDKSIGKRVVPIIPDEARTFGMEGLFRQLGIYASSGQLYKPVDADQVMFYKETQQGQILEEGINEGGAMSSWIASATSYSTNNLVTIPFYIFYSMFGFQRVGDLAWAAADSRARGFLIGATSGRTTLNGEGLQHEDGHSHIFSSVIPNCKSYDPTFGYELVAIIQHGLEQMLEKNVDEYYYITTLNENYQHPDMPKEKSLVSDIVKGLYLLQKPKKKQKLSVNLMGSGAILREVIKAAALLSKYNVSATIYSATSFTELARDGREKSRKHMISPDSKQDLSHIDTTILDQSIPTIAATDYIRSFAEQIRPYMSGVYSTLGTDGFGRSGTREELRRFFEVDANYIAFAALYELFQEDQISIDDLLKIRDELGVNPEKVDPFTV